MLTDCIFMINKYTVSKLNRNVNDIIWIFEKAADYLTPELARSNTDNKILGGDDDCWGIDVFYGGVRLWLVAVPFYIKDKIFVSVGFDGIEESLPDFKDCLYVSWPLKDKPEIKEPFQTKDLFIKDGSHRNFSKN